MNETLLTKNQDDDGDIGLGYSFGEGMGFDSVHLPREKRYSSNDGADLLHIRDVPNFLRGRFEEAVTDGRLNQALSHYTAELESAELLDSVSLKKLKQFSQQAGSVREYEANKNLLKDVKKFLDSLRPRKRGK
jgi:hypothetical protein